MLFEELRKVLYFDTVQLSYYGRKCEYIKIKTDSEMLKAFDRCEVVMIQPDSTDTQNIVILLKYKK